MIVFHVEMIAIVVFFDTAFPVMAGVDVNSVVENMYGRGCPIISPD